MNNDLYTCILVDDEPEIREGIRDTIPWESSGFMLMGACANGNEALSLIEQNLPDVLITDINMPFMDGLSLAERVLTLNPSTRVLIISGYDEFEYARKALKLQVYDYIVKPITPHEFKEILIRLKTNLDEERISRWNFEQLKKQLAESFPLLRERFLNQLVLGKFTKGSSIYTWDERISYLGIPIPLQNTFYLCLVLDGIHRRKGEEFDIDLLAKRQILEQELETDEQTILFPDDEDRLVILNWGLSENQVYRESLKRAEHLRLCLSRAGMGDTVISLGEPVSSLPALNRSYSDAIHALQVAILREQAGIITSRELGTRGDTYPLRTKHYKGIASSIKTLNLAEMYKQIDEIIGDYKISLFDIEIFYMRLRLVLASILQTMDELEIDPSTLFAKGVDPFEEIIALKNLDQIHTWLTTLGERIVEVLQARQENFAEKKIREAMEYIKQKYGDPELSILNLSRDLFISTSYLSAILKKYTSRTFVELLTEVRMEKAKELLRTTSLKTYEIAEQVGYPDAHYFSLSFKKTVGQTPTEYRTAHETPIT
jgi:two-component system response regulator YesN